MRDTLLTLIVAILLILTLRHPFVGALTWAWLGTMNPHRLSFGFAYAFPFAAITAGVTIFGWVFSREPKQLPNHPLLWVLLAWLAWITVTTAFALSQDEAWHRWREVMKVHAMTLVILAMLTTRRRLELLLAVLVASIGFFSVKGGAWVLTGATDRVWGPPDSMIEDNNYLAVATIMIIPLMRYFQQQSSQHWARMLLAVAMGLSAASVLGSYSRGGLLALLAMTVVLLRKSRRRLLLALVFGSVIAGLIAFMPDRWEQRMSTIRNYDEDQSANTRLMAWQTMFNLAKDHPLVGGGFGIDNEQIYQRYSPSPFAGSPVAHSIYFQALGEQGFVGLALVLALLVGAWIVAGRMSHEAELRGADWRWAVDMARLIQASLSGFIVGGAFLNLLHFDFYYYLIAALIALASILRRPG
jgi:putative inorganic carbon (hco3(-)) transporter